MICLRKLPKPYIQWPVAPPSSLVAQDLAKSYYINLSSEKGDEALFNTLFFFFFLK